MFQVGLRWAIIRHESCENDVPHHKFLHWGTKVQTSIPGCFADSVSYRSRNQTELGPCHAVKIFCQDPVVSDKTDPPTTKGCHDVASITVDEVEKQDVVKNFREPVGYIWMVYERAMCTEDDSHMFVVDESKQIFEDYFQCILDFRTNSEYDKFDISREWELYIEAIRTDWL